MNKASRRLTNWVAALALALALALPGAAFAAAGSGAATLGLSSSQASDASDNSSISLTVRYETDADFVRGAMVTLYKVADVLPDGSLSPVAELADLPVNWSVESASDVRGLADTIEAYLVYSDALRGVPYAYSVSGASGEDELAMLAPVDVAITDGNGVGSFPCESEEIPSGCYLVMAGSRTGDAEFIEASPSMLALPYAYESGELDHSPIISLKVRSYSLSRTVTMDVSKVWEVGEGCTAAIEAAARPEEVTAVLLCDGVIYDTAALSEENGWQHSWTGLAAGHQWSVVEEEVPEGYEVSLVKDGTSVTIVNTCTLEEPGEPEAPDTPASSDEPTSKDSKPSQKLPQTGQLWWPVPVLLLVGVACVGAGIRGRRNDG